MKNTANMKILLVVLLVVSVEALRNGLLKTPPMGWLSWEMYQCGTHCTHNQHETCISDRLFLQIAHSLKDGGFLDAGYDRINIDDCWMAKSRDIETGNLLPDPIRFADGMSSYVDQIHQLGFKAGIYQNYGRTTCMGYPGLMGYAKKDAQQFSDWGFDMVKLDACFTPTANLNAGFKEFGGELLRSGRQIAYSCSLGYYQVFHSKVRMVPAWKVISTACNMFRVFHDITATWDSILATIDFMGDNQHVFEGVTGPGSWPDPDMLMVGKPGLSVTEAQTQMAIWCILPAPMFMSNDPRRLEKEFVDILQNRQAIKINQDSLGIQGKRVFHNSTLDVWTRRLADNEMAVVILNRLDNKEIHVQIPFQDLNNGTITGSLHIHEIFTGNEQILDDEPKILDAKVKSHGVVFWRIKNAK